MNKTKSVVLSIFVLLFLLFVFPLFHAQELQTLTEQQIKDIHSQKPEDIDFAKLSPQEIAQLTTVQKQGVTAEQIKDHLEKIDDLSKFKNAQTALQLHFGTTVKSLGQGAKITGTILQATTGAGESIELSSKQGWELTLTDKGEILVTRPHVINRNQIANTDAFTLTENVDLVLEDGTTIKQIKNISFKQGKAYVKKGKEATVDAYHLYAKENEVTLYFNELPESQENYFSILPEGISIGTTESGLVHVDPQPGNKLFAMVKRNYATLPPSLVPDDRDTLSIQVSDGDGLQVTSREESGFTPLITHQDKNGAVQIRTGRMAFHLEYGKILVSQSKPLPFDKPLEEIPSSVAFELTQGATTLRTSSSNRFVLLRSDTEIAGTNMGLRVSNSIDVNSMKTREDLQFKYPALTFAIKDVDAEIQQIETALQEIAEGKLEALLTLGLVPRLEHLKTIKIQKVSSNLVQFIDEWLEQNTERAKKITGFVFDGDFNAAAGGGEETGKFVFGERLVDASTLLEHPIRGRTPSQIVDHEYAHLLDNYIIRDEEHYPREIRDRQGVEARYNQLLTSEFIRLTQTESFKKLRGELDAFQTRINHLGSLKEGKVTLADIEEQYGKIPPEEYAPYDGSFLHNTQPLIGMPLLTLEINEHLQTLENIPSVINDIRAGLSGAANKYPPARKYEQKFDQFIREETGLPPYAFKDYGDAEANHKFAEVSSTLTEIDRDVARRKIAQGNDFFRQATQLAYDTGKMSREDYSYRMENYCARNPCGKCVIYTLTCTPEPAVP